MCVFVIVCPSVYVCVCVHAVHFDACLQMVCLYVYVYVCVYVCGCECVCVYVFACACVFAGFCMCARGAF